MAVSSNLQNSLIMMVDDEPIMIELIRIFLEENGYQHFEGLSDSTTAVAEVTAAQPDILLLDLVMPGVNGFEVLEQLRADEKTKHLPVIVLTSSSDAETKLKALELGATDFLAKPVDQSELALRLRNSLTFKAYQDQLTYYDALTGLPNKKLCLERLSKALTSFKGRHGFLSVLNIRLGQFRKITESYGPKVGETLLKSVSDRLLECVRSSDVVSHGGDSDPTRVTAHLGGDEFSILLTRIENNGDASYVGERLVKAFEKPLTVNGQDFFIPLSIGISIFPGDGDQPEILLSKASSSADLLIDNQESGYQFYSDEANKHLKEKLELQQDLRKALGNGQFHLVYQPQVDGIAKRVCGAEALLRWTHPEKGFVSPAVFIPLAEESGLMVEIGTCVLREACKQSVIWKSQGVEKLTISVNISGKQFRSEDFLGTVKSVLAETQAVPEMIMLEITESLAMSDVDKTVELLADLRALGLEVSVDDFGTGYSSLSYLKDFPIDELKIDKAFVDGLPNNKGDQAIASAIVTMAKKLGYKIVAEGVEELPQVDYLNALGCDLIQGYYFSKPLQPDDFLKYYFELESNQEIA
ncbi:putative bifunctional diguanylate cyclase/phosphodiesterase [Neptuniibacter caesariensis]|uniref:cyclic-guanylate-specific phosphodiesterase n=1 Tax=Neptuniibacter caesariensis TaxID=207954 RepID=A0A7U8C5E3_NEPCE|nr:EAL domain-containing response regulator [Neptuniibacter caesariensis]EAR61559.1 Hybrid signal transduction histidine kinase and diguanylatecyclase/phosphodiesterase [Oceanospirillum sp. MED92] [Neptuniibacter caesariensis]